MPFRIEYSDKARDQFKALKPTDIVAARQLIGSFAHDRWLRGRAITGQTSLDTELMELKNGPIHLRYEIDRHSETVRIVAILVDK